MEMNIVDYVIIGIVAVSLLFGLYRGFIATVLHTGGTLISVALSFWLSPKLAELIQGNTSLQSMLSNYTDISSRLGDLDLALTKVKDLVAQGGDKISEVVQRVGLPEPFATLLDSNISKQIWGDTMGVSTVQDYISQTILHACISIICFVLCFIVFALLIGLVVNIVKAVFRFPVLKQCDHLAGGAFGILRGVLLCYVLMSVVPMIETMIPMDQVTDLIAQSSLASFLSGDRLILAIMNGGL